MSSALFNIVEKWKKGEMSKQEALSVIDNLK
jgi:hypothetical protein